MTHTTREAWLQAACTLVAPILDQGGVTALSDVRVSCGWPARGALSMTRRSMGECWHGENNKDHLAHVFVSPCLEDACEVVGVLVHELIHASLPPKTGHKAAFARAAMACGLDGKPTATTVGDALAKRINAEILPALGSYPHQAIDRSARKPQRTRLLLWECACPVKVRAAERSGFDATCNVCEQAFTMKGEES